MNTTTEKKDSGSNFIRKAIDEVRFSVDLRVLRGAPREYSVVPKLVIVNPIEGVDGNILVPVRGHVPLAFFHWFEDLRNQLEDQQTMLNLCRFEED